MIPALPAFILVTMGLWLGSLIDDLLAQRWFVAVIDVGFLVLLLAALFGARRIEAKP